MPFLGYAHKRNYWASGLGFALERSSTTRKGNTLRGTAQEGENAEAELSPDKKRLTVNGILILL
jgi:hypothetical protein